MFKTAVFVVALTHLCGSETGVTTGKCGNMTDKVVPALNLGKYAGLWYEKERIENRNQENSDCNIALYQVSPDGTLQVRNSQVRNGSVFTENGRGVMTHPPKGIFEVSFPMQPIVGDNYFVIGTDYGNWSLVWSCYQVSPTYKLEVVWYLTRRETVAERHLEANMLIEKYWNGTEFRETEQSAECPNRGQTVP